MRDPLWVTDRYRHSFVSFFCERYRGLALHDVCLWTRNKVTKTGLDFIETTMGCLHGCGPFSSILVKLVS